jgi:hypothetical protein
MNRIGKNVDLIYQHISFANKTKTHPNAIIDELNSSEQEMNSKETVLIHKFKFLME